MTKLTLSFDEDLLSKGKQYASDHKMSLDALIHKLLKEKVESESEDWLEDCFLMMDQANGNSRGKKWQREELHDR